MAAGGGGAAAQEPDLATTLAGFPPDVREEVLMTADEAVLSRLPPALLAEAQARPVACHEVSLTLGTWI